MTSRVLTLTVNNWKAAPGAALPCAPPLPPPPAAPGATAELGPQPVPLPAVLQGGLKHGHTMPHLLSLACGSSCSLLTPAPVQPATLLAA